MVKYKSAKVTSYKNGVKKVVFTDHSGKEFTTYIRPPRPCYGMSRFQKGY